MLGLMAIVISRWFVALILQVLFVDNLLFLPDGLSSVQSRQIVLKHPLAIGIHLCCPSAKPPDAGAGTLTKVYLKLVLTSLISSTPTRQMQGAQATALSMRSCDSLSPPFYVSCSCVPCRICPYSFGRSPF
ncbi:hypothetical protein K438DRAFT_1853998 [Mycena galopus ATCC 62051]|nr:hypothetical protein K438DRAFT_1853974 [Mycena galopus ATCC 62051]KAF8170476.1 hypothetical protein K438DRAFT_1853998 [Mycena galopus ATCC 62051]